MKATDLLKQQHNEVKTLFKHLEKTNGGKSNEIFEKLAASLVAHDAIEREIFYPACEEGMGMTDLLGEALVEHGVVEFSLYLADQAKEDDDFEAKCTVLRELLEHHIDEEEDEFFPKVEKALGDEALEDLGAEMKHRFDQALQEDFRVVLHGNLQQVLAGATKTKPEPSKAKASSATPRAPKRTTTASKGKGSKRAHLTRA
jgi:hemerythrin superfamily protein